MKNYQVVPGDDLDQDVELGETAGIEDQESGVVHPHEATVTEQLDNWDENAEDWEDNADEGVADDGQKTPGSSTDDGDMKKRDI